jgi:hypothetical protein
VYYGINTHLGKLRKVYRIAMAQTAFNKKKIFHQQIGLKFKEETKCNVWSIALYGAKTWALRKVDQKYLESLETWCWRRMKKISWTDHVRNEEVLHRVKEDRNILNTIQRRKANWFGHILYRNCLLKHVIEGKLGEG